MTLCVLESPGHIISSLMTVLTARCDDDVRAPRPNMAACLVLLCDIPCACRVLLMPCHRHDCRECLEVKCRSASIPAGGSTLDRTGLCLSDKSVKVKIVDTCPCVYPNKAASNKLWCCGDFPHLDLSQWALEKVWCH